MNSTRKILVGAIASIGLGIAAAAVSAHPTDSTGGMQHEGMQHGEMQHGGKGGGHHARMRQGMGPGMGRGPVGMLTTQDANSAADMAVSMNLVHDNTKIRRTVTRLPDGIRTVTESDDPKIAQDIKAHVASMSGRLKDGREFNIFSTTLPVIFDNAKNISSAVEFTDKGAIVTRTSTDAKVAAALQAHAGEVTELVQEGPVAFHRGIDARMRMGPGGPRSANAPAPAKTQPHAH